MKIALFFALGFLVMAARGENVKGLEVKVMSFNVRWDGLDEGANAWANRRPVAITVIEAHAPDVIGLQEPSPAQTRDLDEGLADYVSFQAGHVRDQHITFLYRSERYRLSQAGSFWLVAKSDLTGGTRRCVWIRLIEKKSGRAFYVFNSHFDHRSPSSRRQSALALVNGIRKREFNDPYVALGDFNETEKEPAIKYLTGVALPADGDSPAIEPLVALVDTFRAKYPDRLGDGSGHGFSGRTTGPRVDFIFASRQDEILKAGIIRDNEDGFYPSDHFPVVATIRLEPSP